MPEYGVNIAESFEQYLKTGDSSLIEKYSRRELETAVSRLSPHYDNNKLWYRELERRIEELRNKEEFKREKLERLTESWKEKWFDRVIAFVAGVVIGIMMKVF